MTRMSARARGILAAAVALFTVVVLFSVLWSDVPYGGPAAMARPYFVAGRWRLVELFGPLFAALFAIATWLALAPGARDDFLARACAIQPLVCFLVFTAPGRHRPVVLPEWLQLAVGLSLVFGGLAASLLLMAVAVVRRRERFGSAPQAFLLNLLWLVVAYGYMDSYFSVFGD